MPGFFVTGTDTGVGKTFATCAIAAGLKQQGRPVGVFKPAETGCEKRGDTLVAADGAQLLAMCESGQSDTEVCPVRFPAPAAPLAAARAVGATVDTSRLVSKVRDLAKRFDPVLVEGAGGLLVPLGEGVTYADFAIELGLPVIVVVGAKLGCINHALLTFDALESRRLPIAGWILNEVLPSPDEALAHETHRDLIQEFSNLPFLGHLPYILPERCRSPKQVAALGNAHLALDQL